MDQNQSNLFSRIRLRISYEKTLAKMRKYSPVIGAVLIVAIILARPAWNEFRSDILHSGFVQYLLLGFSDFRIVLDNWQDYGLTLLESFPAMSIAMFLSVVLGILVAIRFGRVYTRTAKNNQTLKPHI